MRNRFAIASVAVMLAGCGAIMHGARQDMDVQSSPAGAKVETSPAEGTYTTPTRLSLQRKNSYVLTFTAPGYEPATFNIHNGIGTGTVIADVLLTGLVGVVVDGLTGSWYGLSPESAIVTLTRPGGSENDADAIHVSVGIAKDRQGASITSSSPEVRVRVTSR
jgi:hypothetical protein